MRSTTEPRIDGELDEPMWEQAARLTGFSQLLPVDGRPADDSTEVFVWYSPTAIHFGIRAYEAHGVVRATLADRDRIDAEDHVQIILDTYLDRRRAFVFAVNALGVQADGTRGEGQQGGNTPRNGLGNSDLSSDFIFETKGKLTEWGYQVEVRIPFKTLRYAGTKWGLQFVRQVQHSGFQDTWAPVKRGAASFLVQAGTLDGMRDMKRGLVLDLNPVVTNSVNGSPRGADGASWGYANVPEIGGNVRWGLTSNLTMNATLNPDFSQVEADAQQVPNDIRFAVFFPERRPFFTDGIDLFQLPNQLVYTRRIVAPSSALRLSGKIGHADLAVL
ncbi:MAG: carbohydrate binding family 9 domain-containing protein, partial [Gemmatimonadaceae bacterium]|nr:carbohydrate binding family 9 domain-containing protein [Gemmatimonadaceae bacterium]